MPRLYLVRHGQAAAGFGDHADPGLNALGRAQALQTAQHLGSLAPMRIISSPLARARETAMPLLELWHGHAPPPLHIDARVSEIASGDGDGAGDLARRAEWLASIMGTRWSQLGAPLQQWARGVVLCLLEQPADAVLFSHFIAINVAVGWATGDDRVVHFRPGNASVSILETDGWHLRLLEPGAEGDSKVN